MDDVRRAHALEDGLGGFSVAEVAVLRRQEDPRRVLLLRRAVDVCSNSHAVQAGAAGDHANYFAIGFRHFGSCGFLAIFG